MSESLDLKITKAMERIEELYYQTEGKCYLSFSGGKDSTVILALIKMCEEIYTLPKNAIPAVFSNTGIELGATVDFVKWVKENWYQNVEIIRPEKPFQWIMENHGKPMKSKLKSDFISRYQVSKRVDTGSFAHLLGNSRDGKNCHRTRLADKDLHMIHDNLNIKVSDKCCHILKKKPFEKYKKENDIKGYLLGERLAEGGARDFSTLKRLSLGGKICTKTKGKYLVKLPIVDWTNEDIETFIEKYNVPLSKAYTEQGYERTGCFMCPFSLQIEQNLTKLHEYEPNRYKASMVWLEDVFIAQNVKLPFDEAYEKKRKEKWTQPGGLFDMRLEMLERYRPEKLEKYKHLSSKEYWTDKNF